MLLLLAAVAAIVALPVQLANRVIEPSHTNKRATIDRGLFVVQFRANLHAELLRQLEATLGYMPTEYVPFNALVLFFNSTETATNFSERFLSQVVLAERLSPGDRRAAGVAFGKTTGAVRATRDGAAEAPQRSAPEHVALRVRSFRDSVGVYADDDDDDGDRREERYARRLVATVGVAGSVATSASSAATIEQVAASEVTTAADSIVEQLDDVYWVEALAPYETLNSWGVPAAHCAVDAERVVAPLVDQIGWSPLLGLRGANQTIGLSDTGVQSMCFFTDGRGLASGNWPTGAGVTRPIADTNHPKIRAYTSGTNGDLADLGIHAGHGTHVAGTLVGRAESGSPSEAYNGIAPDARLAFVDMMGGGNTPYLSVPDIGAMMRWIFAHDARISSNSWGSNNAGAYTADDRDVDMAVWQMRELLVVVAAGNEGTEGSISTPAMNKNGLSVGATMNGYDAYAEAGTPPRPLADMSPRWLASFSSRGAATLPFAKPDVVAPGGQYVWSANNLASADSCTDVVDTTAGLAGTSMATPLVAGAAALVYEALQRSNGATITRNGGGSLPVYASLVRAVLAASGRPLDGIYPHRPYSNPQARRNAEGFGRVALDRVLGSSATLAVLSNERTAHGLLRTGDSRRACISISGVAPGATLAGFELVIQLAYADYPSSVVAAPTLVNNLDLRVSAVNRSTLFAVNYNTPGVAETRTTLERVVISPAQAVDVQVVATQLGFGGAQTFSLIAVLRPIDVSSTQTRQLVVNPLSSSTQPCAVCSESKVAPTNECATCGNGRVEAGEQCDGGECCNSCRWRPTNTTCNLDIGQCRAAGLCRATGECAIDNRFVYSAGPGGECVITTLLGVCPRRAEWWMQAIRASTVPSSLRISALTDGRICCQQFARFAHDRHPSEPLYHRLATEYIAATLNAASDGVTVPGSVLVAIRTAAAALETRCGVGFLAADERATARSLAAELYAFNAPSCSAAVDADNCPVPAAAATTMCSGAPNQYDSLSDQCTCAAGRHNESDCAHLTCSGNGASVRVGAVDTCVCLPGWTGAACAECAPSAVPGTRFVCIGALRTAIARGSPAYFLQAVNNATVTARLTGSYYTAIARRAGKAAPAKLSDGLPGVGALDCWCRPASARSPLASTHRDTLASAIAQLSAQMQWSGAPDMELVTARASAERIAVGAAALVAFALHLY